VRELQNVVERAVILAEGGALTFDLPDSKAAAAAPAGNVASEVIPEVEWRKRERANVMAALAHSGYRVSGPGGAAELLGIPAATLTSRLKSLGIQKKGNRRYE